MQFSLLTYNILLNDARSSIQKLGETYHPDIMCIQELNTGVQIDTIAGNGYRLAEYSNCFLRHGSIFGGAIYYNPKTLRYHSSKLIYLPLSYYEILRQLRQILLFKKRNRAVIKASFTHKQSKKKITVYNIHLSAQATNGVRIKQLKKTLKEIDHGDTSITVLAGDFNFPFGRKKLEKTMRFCGFSEATSNLLYTTDKRMTYYTSLEKMGKKLLDFLFKKRPFKLDYIFYRNCTHLKTKRINAPLSDHFPVFSTFTDKTEGTRQLLLPDKKERDDFFAEENKDETDLDD